MRRRALSEIFYRVCSHNTKVLYSFSNRCVFTSVITKDTPLPTEDLIWRPRAYVRARGGPVLRTIIFARSANFYMTRARERRDRVYRHQSLSEVITRRFNGADEVRARASL